jgi:hypothetical protein
MAGEEERLAGTTTRKARKAFVVESIERNSMNNSK